MKLLLIFISSLFFTSNFGSNAGDNFNTPSGDDNGMILILNKSANTAWQLDAKTGEQITEYQTGNAPHEVAVSPDQSRAIITNYGSNTPGNSLTVIDLDNQKVSKTISLGEFQRPHGIEWFSDGIRAIVTAEEQQAVLIIDIDSGEILSAINTDQQVSHMVKLAGDEETAYVTNLGSGSLSILDLTSGEAIQTLKTGAGTEGVTVIPRKNEVWITNRSANTISIFDATSNEIAATLESSSFPIRAEVSPNEQLVAVSNAQSSEVSVFDVDSRQQIQKISTTRKNQSGAPIGLTFSSDGSFLFAANSAINEIAVIDTQDWQVINNFTTGTTPDGIAYISSN